MSTAGSVSSAMRARTFTEDDEHLVMALSAQVGRIYENLAFSAAALKRARRARTRDSRAQTGGVGRCATSVTGRSDTWTRPKSSCSSWTWKDGSRSSIATPARSSDGPRTSCSGATGSRRAFRPGYGTMLRTTFHNAARRRSFGRREPCSHQVGRGTAHRVAQHGCCEMTRAASSARSALVPTSPNGIRRSRRCEPAEERMRFALEAAGVGIWDMDYTTGVLRWSETLEAQYGLQPGTFGGTFEAFVERIHPDDRASVLETIGEAMKSGSDFSVLTPIDLARRHGAVAERRGPDPPRRGRRTDARRRYFPGRHRAPRVGGTVSAGAEDGSHRTAGRWRGARLQQSADRDSGVLRDVARRISIRTIRVRQTLPSFTRRARVPPGSHASCWHSAASRSSSRRCST